MLPALRGWKWDRECKTQPASFQLNGRNELFQRSEVLEDGAGCSCPGKCPGLHSVGERIQMLASSYRTPLICQASSITLFVTSSYKPSGGMRITPVRDSEGSCPRSQKASVAQPGGMCSQASPTCAVPITLPSCSGSCSSWRLMARSRRQPYPWDDKERQGLLLALSHRLS